MRNDFKYIAFEIWFFILIFHNAPSLYCSGDIVPDGRGKGRTLTDDDKALIPETTNLGTIEHEPNRPGSLKGAM